MGKELDVTFYNDAFRRNKAYSLEISGLDSSYKDLFNGVLKHLTKEDKIIELGCGSGQLAEMIINGGFKYVQGIDFSIEALSLARQRVAADFLECDLSMYRFYNDYNTIVSTEVFEHITKDIEVIERIKTGAKVIFSVPTFDYKSHVRHFETIEQVSERYGSQFNDFIIEQIGRIFLFVGIKR